MKEEDQTREHLIDEVKELRQQIDNFKTFEIEHKQTFIKLRESEEKYKNIIELAPDSIITFNLKGIITSFNKNFSSLSFHILSDSQIRNV